MAWLPKKLVVVPFDFSDDSQTAIHTALELVAQPEDVIVVHVLPELTPLEPSEAWQTFDNNSRIEHTLQLLRERLAAPELAKVRLQVLIGDPGHNIATFAATNAADLVVLPSHGRTGLARMLIGSVAERVVRLAHCPVLVLRK